MLNINYQSEDIRIKVDKAINKILCVCYLPNNQNCPKHFITVEILGIWRRKKIK